MLGGAGAGSCRLCGARRSLTASVAILALLLGDVSFLDAAGLTRISAKLAWPGALLGIVAAVFAPPLAQPL